MSAGSRRPVRLPTYEAWEPATAFEPEPLLSVELDPEEVALERVLLVAVCVVLDRLTRWVLCDDRFCVVVTVPPVAVAVALSAARAATPMNEPAARTTTARLRRFTRRASCIRLGRSPLRFVAAAPVDVRCPCI
jgi:hypothetical protein